MNIFECVNFCVDNFGGQRYFCGIKYCHQNTPFPTLSLVDTSKLVATPFCIRIGLRKWAFKMIIKHYKKVGYNLDIMQQSACLVLNPITDYSYGFLFNCTKVTEFTVRSKVVVLLLLIHC